jgi:mRNA interferase MazF
MIREGQVVLFRFPQTDQAATKLRPAVVLRRVPGPFEDWLVCMISSQLGQEIAGMDETLTPGEPDFAATGLKVPSVIRITRLAVAERSVLCGAIGQVTSQRLLRIKARLGEWLTGS